MDRKKLDELRELDAKATPAPWYAEVDEGEGEVQVNAGSARTEWNGNVGRPARSWLSTDRILERSDLWDADLDQVAEDADLIATMRNALPELLDELARLDGELARLQGENARLDLLAKGRDRLGLAAVFMADAMTGDDMEAAKADYLARHARKVLHAAADAWEAIAATARRSGVSPEDWLRERADRISVKENRARGEQTEGTTEGDNG